MFVLRMSVSEAETIGKSLIESKLLMLAAQVAHLRSSGINVASLTSLTPKETIAEVYKTIDTDQELRLLYGTHSRLLGSASLPCCMITALPSWRGGA